MSESRRGLVSYPEHEKLHAAKTWDATQALGEFLHEFLPQVGITLAEWDHDGNELVHWYGSLDKLAAQFFGIDYQALQHEKDTLLEEARRSS